MHPVRASIVLFAAMVALTPLTMLECSAQGLVGMPPNHPPRPSRETYKKWAAEAEPEIQFWGALYAFGMGNLPKFADEYGEKLLNQSRDWEEADESEKAEIGYKRAIAVEQDPERLSQFYAVYRSFLWDRQRYQDMVRVSEQCVERDEQAWGADDTRLCPDLKMLAQVYRCLSMDQIERGNKMQGIKLRDKQIACYRRALAIHEHAGQFSFDWNMTAQDLAESLTEAGRLPEAEATWTQALQWHRKYDAGSFWHAGQMYGSVSRFYMYQYPGKARQCEPIVDEFLLRWKHELTSPKTDCYFARDVVADYASFLEETHRTAKAKELHAIVRQIDAQKQY